MFRSVHRLNQCSVLGLTVKGCVLTAIGWVMFVYAPTGLANDFWQDTQALQTGDYISPDQQHRVSLSQQVLSNDNQQVTAEVSSLSFNGLLNVNTEWALQLADTRDERSLVVGFTHNDLSVSLLRGSGEDFLKIATDYAGVDPYLFHGGWQQRFDYHGYAINYRLPRLGHVQFGQATITSNGLSDRSTRYLEWSNNALFARATRVYRDAESLGYGVDAGVAFNNKRLAYQTLQLDNSRSIHRLRLQVQRNDSQQVWFDISSHRNPLFEKNDDYRVMFTFKSLLGKRSLVSKHSQVNTNSQPDQPKQAKSNRKWRRGVYIGAGVVAAAAISSSGSDSQDNSVRLASQNDAAFDVLNRVNPKSVRENREYGGYIYVNPDGSFSATPEVRGEEASVTLPAFSSLPVGSRATASYHTHAAFDPRFDNENFSPTDLNSDRQFNLDGYLGTPLGFLKLHDVETGNISTLGRINN